MDIETRKQAGIQVLKLRGSIKLGEPVDRLLHTMDSLISSGDTQVVANLAEVPTADSSGIGALVRYHTSLKQRGGALKLVSPSNFLVQTLRVLGLYSIFEVFENEQAAVQSFASPSTFGQAVNR